MKVFKEELYHFSCDYCKLWWSIAISLPMASVFNYYCPHCGKPNNVEEIVDGVN